MFLKIKIFLFILYASAFGLDEIDSTESKEDISTESKLKEITDMESNEVKTNKLEPPEENPLQRSSICLYRNPAVVVSSVDLQKSEFPWMVGIYRPTNAADEAKIYKCAGALIAPNALLTSAHCVHQFMDGDTVIGVQIGFKDSIESKTVKKIIMLDHFELDYHMNAIAILLLSSPFELKEHIQPVCLPPPNANFDGEACQLLHYNSSYDVGYKKFDFRISAVKDCNSRLRQMNRQTELPLHESIICATSPMSEELCHNLLGSPLICPIFGVEDQYFLAGITSFGETCPKDETNVNFFVNVALFSRWIEYQLRQEETANLPFSL